VWAWVDGGFTKHAPQHITFENPDNTWESAKKHAKEIGMLGGALVLHPWRIKPEFKREANDYGSRHKENRYAWVKKQSDPLSVLLESPHCHAISYGKLVPVVAGSKEYLYTNLRDVVSQEDATALLSYLLSHTSAPVAARGQAIRYVGNISTRTFRPELSGTVKEPMPCPECGHEVRYDDTGDLVMLKHYTASNWFIVKPVRPPPISEVNRIPGHIIRKLSPGQSTWDAMPTTS
jgi:hypothetical protein